MNSSATRLALTAAFIAVVLSVAGCSASTQPAAHSASPAITASASASASTAPSAPADGEDTSGSAPSDAAAPSVAAVPAAPESEHVPEVKSIHSPDKVAIDETLTPGECKVRTVDAASGDYLPDPACTPGAIDPAVTQENLASTICKSGYTTTVRAPASDTDRVKALSLVQYGQTRAASTEFDHLISLQLGGTNSVSNLWPEPNRAGAPGTTNPKDAIETRLNKAVCSHKVTLDAAQKAIAHDWVTAEKDLGL